MGDAENFPHCGVKLLRFGWFARVGFRTHFRTSGLVSGISRDKSGKLYAGKDGKERGSNSFLIPSCHSLDIFLIAASNSANRLSVGSTRLRFFMALILSLPLLYRIIGNQMQCFTIEGCYHPVNRRASRGFLESGDFCRRYTCFPAFELNEPNV